MQTNKRKGIMLCYPFEERRLTEKKFGWSFPVIVQPKLDGERCRAIITGNDIVLLSSEENEIIAVPHIIEGIKAQLIKDVELDGELYCHGMDFSDIHSIVSRKKELHEDYQKIKYHIFDLVAEKLPTFARLHFIETHIKENKAVKLVPKKLAYSMQDIIEIYNEYVDL